MSTKLQWMREKGNEEIEIHQTSCAVKCEECYKRSKK